MELPLIMSCHADCWMLYVDRMMLNDAYRSGHRLVEKSEDYRSWDGRFDHHFSSLLAGLQTKVLSLYDLNAGETLKPDSLTHLMVYKC